MSPPSRRSWIATLLAVSLVAGTLGAGGAIGQEDAGTTDAEPPDQDSAFLRVAHVSPDAPAVDVFIDGERVLANVSFGEVSDYSAFPAGEHDVTIAAAAGNGTAGDDVAADGRTVVFEGNVTLEARSVTTLFASGEVGENAAEPLEPVLFEDGAFEPAENESAVSVAHMSPGAPAVDVTAANGSVVLAENLSFRQASQYATVPAGDYTVEVRPASPGNDATPVATVNVSLEGETAYSALAIGYLDADETADGEAFRVALVEDATKTVHLPSEEGTPEVTETPTATGTPAAAENGTETTTEEATATDEPGDQTTTETVEA